MNYIVDSLEYLFYSQLAFWVIIALYMFYINKKMNGKD
jgi:hypothetical protein